MRYQIVDWNQHFENDRSRQRDRCGYVCMPNKQDGMGLTYILSQDDGDAIMGIWTLIVEACSRQKRGRDGWLTDDGTASGRAWTASDLALRWRRKEQSIERALSVLTSVNVGWIKSCEEVTADSPPTNHAVTADSPSKEGKGKEEKGRESAANAAVALPAFQVPAQKIPEPDYDGFLSLWNTQLPTPIPRIRGWTSKRKTAFKARWAGSDFRENWQAALGKVANSRFCLGESTSAWVANVDWFLRPDTLTKILEGNYDNGNPNRQGTFGSQDAARVREPGRYAGRNGEELAS